jgi:betaine-homocysteine S-methyltransferase
LREQLRWQKEAGADFVIAETFSRLDEAVIATEEAKSVGLPVITTLCFKATPVTIDGFTASESAKRLVGAGADAVGINCQRDPGSMLSLTNEMREAVDRPLAAQPLGLRTPDGWLETEDPAAFERMQLSRDEWQAFGDKAQASGIGYVGACCGAGPSGIRGIAEALENRLG